MELIHTALADNANGIKKNGLLSSKKMAHTLLTATSENGFKPQYLPDFINMNKCIYFFPLEEAILSSALEKLQALAGVLMPKVVTSIFNDNYFDKIIHVQVSTEDLDINKLYVASVEKSEKITLLNRNFLTDNNINLDELIVNDDHESIEKIIKSDSYRLFLQENKACIEEYWNSMIPFSEYEENWNKIPFHEKFDYRNYLKYEILYFDDIPDDKIQIKSDLFKLQDLVDFLQVLGTLQQGDLKSNLFKLSQDIKIS